MINEKLYKRIQQVLPICTVDILVKNEKNEFLLLKRKNRPAKRQWWFPGGRVEKGETLEKAALRKAKEETGLDVILIKIIGVDETIFRKGFFGGSSHTINIVFLAKTKGRYNIKLDNQSANYKWFKKINVSWHPYIRKFARLSGFK